jgi:hypothetical protein
VAAMGVSTVLMISSNLTSLSADMTDPGAIGQRDLLLPGNPPRPSLKR